MSNVIIDKQKIDILANAISCKSGEAVTMTLDEMVSAVDGIETGGGITPTGNIDITSAGVTDVTNYATATVAEGDVYVGANSGYYTSNGVYKWHYQPYASVVLGEDEGAVGFLEDGYFMGGSDSTFNAVALNTSVTPTESAQTVGGVNYMMAGAVTVKAIPSNYVGSGITQRTSSDLTASGPSVTVPSGYYASDALKTVSSGQTGLPITSVTKSDGKFNVRIYYGNAVAGYIGDVSGIQTGSTFVLTVEDETVTPSTSQQRITPTSNAYYLNSVTVEAMPSGTEGTPTATKGTVSNHSVTVTPSVTNTAGYISGGTKAGTAVSVSASELVSGTYSVTSSGTKDVTNYASASVPAGTEGTPTATKGTVSNHSITVTPSVTNTTGWIAGSTKTGTAVTVNVSELESGTKSITNNGTGISVTGYSAVDVAVQGSVVVTDVPNLTGTGASVTADDVTTLVTKTITQNGTYNASSDSADGYSSVTVNVSGGTPSATQHTIHLEFSDSTDTDIPVYYNDSLLGTIITAYEPSTWTYSSKTVTLAQLDGTTWYDKQSIPLNTELIDYSACLDDYAINAQGQAVATQWYVATDYTPCESGMTFSFRGCRWYYMAFYDSTQAFISSVSIDSVTTPDPNDSNVGIGTMSTGIPANTKYVRLTGTGAYSSRLSLIRTA